MGKISYISIFILIFYLNQIFCDDEDNDVTSFEIPSNIEEIKPYQSQSTYDKPIGYKCSSNLECNSACCSSDKCSDSSKCEKLVRTVYICEAVLCFAFSIAFTIYLIIKLKRIKEDFKKKTSEDDQNNHKEN